MAWASLAGSVQAEPVRVLMLGDSLSIKGNLFVGGDEPGPSFADQLEVDLGEDYEVINVACAGTTATNWGLRDPSGLCAPYPWHSFPNGVLVDRALPQLPVDIATILLGTNDAVRRFESQYTTPEAYGEAIGEIVDALLAGGADRVILMTPPDIADAGAHRRVGAYREEILARCGNSERQICGPDFFTLLDLKRDFTDRQLHPNARGHARMAKALGDSIRKLREAKTHSHSLLALVVLSLLAVLFFWGVRRFRRSRTS